MKRFEQFIRERQYLCNVSPRTIDWHSQSLKWLGIEEPNEDDLKAAVLRMREAGLKASSVNCRIRSINAYLHWNTPNAGPKCGSGCRHLKLSKLKEEQRVLPTYSQKDITLFLRWKPQRFYDRRTQAIVLTLADTGCRVSEALGLRWQDVNLDDLLLTVVGKGNKQRVIPFSIELRKFLFKFRQQLSLYELVFCTPDGKALTIRNTYRDVVRACKTVGVHMPERGVHAWRHSMASNFIRRGGSVALLQRVLGHSNISTTMKYVHLQTADLSSVHQRVSLLSN